jgi:hypothetical protein
MDIGEKRVGKNRKERVEEKDLKEADRLTMMIKELEKSPETNKTKIAELKTKRHEIMKKESHEILIVKRS